MSSTSASSDDSSVSSPGLKVPATALPTAFWHGGAGRNDEPYTVHDIKMSVLSYAIRCKEDWKCKLADPVIRGKWREEALKVEPLDLEGEGEYQRALKTDRKRYEGLTEEMVDWVFAELDWLAKDDSSVINPSCFDGIYESDKLIPSSHLEALRTQVAKLENVPVEQQDWHPGSDHRVLDLVHPSLFPVHYGHTTRKDGTVIESVGDKLKQYEGEAWSKHSQWLPTDFTVAEDGKVTIDSYINNLHPDLHDSFYPILAALFSRFVPLFERVLTDLVDPPARRIPLDGGAWDWYDEEESDPEGSDDDSDEDWREHRTLTLPSPGKFEAPVQGGRKEFRIRGRTVQVIVKLANIVLTPEQPEYEGGVWHVEGMRDEAIVASGIYYYDQENGGESSLAFRGSFAEDEIRYDQGDHRGVEIVFGIEDGDPSVQDFNSLSTSLHRCIAFPNTYQHCVSPFALLDPTRPGHRKILVFFLVKPTFRIPSTTEVGPQQREWAEREIWKDRVRGSTLPVLPPELWGKVLEESGLWTMEEAKKVREELMQERKYFVEQEQGELFERPFSLCEH